MRHLRILPALAALPVALATLAAVPSAAQATAPTVAVSGITMSSSAKLVRGSALTYVDVSLHIESSVPLTDTATYVDGEALFGNLITADCLCVLLKSAGPRGRADSAVTLVGAKLTLVSGTPNSGDWHARAALNSAQGGRWKVDGIGAPLSGPDAGATRIPVSGSPIVSFRGSGWLTVDLTRARGRLSAGRPVVVTGTARYARGARPAARVRLIVGFADECRSASGRAVRTDAQGRFRLVVRPVAYVPSTLVQWALPINGRTLQEKCVELADVPVAR